MDWLANRCTRGMNPGPWASLFVPPAVGSGTMPNGPWLEVASTEAARALLADAPADVEEHFALKQAGLEHIPWLAADAADAVDNDKTRALALCPTLFELWWLEDYWTVKRGRLEPKLKELLSLHVASGVECASCVPYHEGAARSEGATDEEIAIVRAFEDRRDELPESLAAAIELGYRAVYEPTAIDRADIDRLRGLGYGDADLVELVNAAFLAHRHAALNRTFNLGQG